MPGPRVSPARPAARSSTPPPTRTTRSTRFSARSRRTAATSGSIFLSRTIRAARMPRPGFKLDYKGEIVEESYVTLGHPGFPGGTVEDRLDETRRGLSPSCPAAWGSTSSSNTSRPACLAKIPFFSAFTVGRSDVAGTSRMPPSACSAGANWAPNLDTPQNKKFVSGI